MDYTIILDRTAEVLQLVLFVATVMLCYFPHEKKLKNILITAVLSPSASLMFYYLVSYIIRTVHIWKVSSAAEMLIYFVVNGIAGVTFTFVFMILVLRFLKPENKGLCIFLYMTVYVFLTFNQVISNNVGYVSTFIVTLLVICGEVFCYWLFISKPLSSVIAAKPAKTPRIMFVIPLFSLATIYGIYVFDEVVDYSFNNLLLAIPGMLEDDPEIWEIIGPATRIYGRRNGREQMFLIASIMFLNLISFNYILRSIIHTDELEDKNAQIKQLSVELMESLSAAIDSKDVYTAGHSQRVAQYSRLIAEKIGLAEEECENVYYYGLLHDVGKIHVPNAIINKPSRLTDEEFDIIKTHPGAGYDILSRIKSRPDLAIGAHWHHERIDGRGYPDHKKGDEIPFLARIIAVADAYDAMTSNRSYRQYLPQDVVRSEIEKGIGTQFDEQAARCMLQVIDDDTEYKLHE